MESMETGTDGSPTLDRDSGQGAEDAGEAFRFERFFEGPVRGWGYFEDRFRKIRSRFDIEMTGSWVDETFVVDEVLRLDNGTVQKRRWRVTVLGGGRYRAQVDDVVGEATGVAVEKGIHWSYRMEVPVSGRTLVLAFDDRMHGGDNGGAVLNVAVAKKWGVTVGRLVATYRRA